jgi:hypothetical protein
MRLVSLISEIYYDPHGEPCRVTCHIEARSPSHGNAGRSLVRTHFGLESTNDPALGVQSLLELCPNHGQSRNYPLGRKSLVGQLVGDCG